MPTHTAPGVFIEEVPTVPPAIAQSPTSLPAFVGYTESASWQGVDLRLQSTEVSSLQDFHDRFGSGPPPEFEQIEIDDQGVVTRVEFASPFYLYDAIQLFFSNGGERCFIVSVGGYAEPVTAAALIEGLAILAGQAEPTLLAFPDAVGIGTDRFYDVAVAALRQAGQRRDRFVIFDLLARKSGAAMTVDETVADFRQRIGTEYLDFGAAYVPHLTRPSAHTVTYRAVHNRFVRRGRAVLPGDGLFGTDPAVTNAAVGAADAIADSDQMNAWSSEFRAAFGADGAARPKRIIRSKIRRFRKRLAAFAETDASPRAFRRLVAAYRDLFDVGYELARILIDPVAQPDATSPIRSPELRRRARKQIKGTVDHLLRGLNQMTVEASARVGWPEKHDRRYLGLAMRAEEWTAFAANLPALPAADVARLYPEVTSEPGMDAAARRRVQARNMETSVSEIRRILKRIRQAAAALGRTATDIEEASSGELVAASSVLRTALQEIADTPRAIPPSGAVAGIYVHIDQTRGVHKAPASIAITGVGLSEALDDHDQESLNVDPVDGKSINAIREFPGRGVLVWGARTLAGNSNEWRYVSVRRFAVMLEVSIRRATEPFVFEPNDANTWARLRQMTENFLMAQWRNGALPGAKPEDSYFVRVGLGETMTAVDILEGRLIVEVGFAAVRPAEFIVLRIVHSVLEA